MRHYPKEIVWKRTISYFFAIFKGLTNKPIPTMNSYVSEAEYEEMMSIVPLTGNQNFLSKKPKFP